MNLFDEIAQLERQAAEAQQAVSSAQQALSDAHVVAVKVAGALEFARQLSDRQKAEMPEQTGPGPES